MDIRWKYIAVVLVVISIAACNPPEDEDPPEDAIVSVYRTGLSASELEELIPDALPSEDSLQIASDYIRKWINQQLMYRKAMSELNDTADIARKIREFRRQLYIYEFEQQYLANNLDSVVDRDEVETYYKKHLSEYVLDRIAVKAHYMTMDVNVGTYYRELAKVRRSSSDNMTELYDAMENTNKEIVEHRRWIFLDDLLDEINAEMNPQVRSGLDIGYFSTVDTTHRYIIKINELLNPGDTIPVDLLETKISEIILNKRKQNLLADLKNQLRENAKLENNLIIHEN